MNAFERVVEAFRDNGLIVDQKSSDRALCQAPGHSPADRSVLLSYNGDQALIHSYAHEDTGDILDAVDLRYADLFDSEKGVEYEYPDGRTVHRSVDKRFFQQGNTKGDQLYHVDRLGDAETVYVVGGEKDVHTLEYNGHIATCNAGGEGNVGNFDLSPLLGRNIIVVRDNDATGEKFARILVEKLTGFSKVSVVTAAEGKDATDHLAAGLGVEDFKPDPAFDALILVTALQRKIETLNTDEKPEKIVAQLYAMVDSTVPIDLTNGLLKFDALIGEWWEDLESNELEVIETPWVALNAALSGGFRKGQSVLCAARPGKGKSLLLTNFAGFAAMSGHRGALFSVEMSRLEIASRMVASGSHTDYQKITQRNLSADDMANIAAWITRAESMGLYVCDQETVTLDKIRKDCRQLKAHGGLDFVCVDYLQLLTSNHKNASRQEQISEISRGLKLLAKELDVVVMSACQLNRGNEKDNRPPSTSDLRESGSLEQDCDVCILLHHPPVGDPRQGEVDMILGKNRGGPQSTITQAWQAHIARIGEMANADNL